MLQMTGKDILEQLRNFENGVPQEKRYPNATIYSAARFSSEEDLISHIDEGFVVRAALLNTSEQFIVVGGVQYTAIPCGSCQGCAFNKGKNCRCDDCPKEAKCAAPARKDNTAVLWVAGNISPNSPEARLAVHRNAQARWVADNKIEIGTYLRVTNAVSKSTGDPSGLFVASMVEDIGTIRRVIEIDDRSVRLAGSYYFPYYFLAVETATERMTREFNDWVRTACIKVGTVVTILPKPKEEPLRFWVSSMSAMVGKSYKVEKLNDYTVEVNGYSFPYTAVTLATYPVDVPEGFTLVEVNKVDGRLRFAGQHGEVNLTDAPNCSNFAGFGYRESALTGRDYSRVLRIRSMPRVFKSGTCQTPDDALTPEWVVFKSQS